MEIISLTDKDAEQSQPTVSNRVLVNSKKSYKDLQEIKTNQEASNKDPSSKKSSNLLSIDSKNKDYLKPNITTILEKHESIDNTNAEVEIFDDKEKPESISKPINEKKPSVSVNKRKQNSKYSSMLNVKKKENPPFKLKVKKKQKEDIKNAFDLRFSVGDSDKAPETNRITLRGKSNYLNRKSANSKSEADLTSYTALANKAKKIDKKDDALNKQSRKDLVGVEPNDSFMPIAKGIEDNFKPIRNDTFEFDLNNNNAEQSIINENKVKSLIKSSFLILAKYSTSLKRHLVSFQAVIKFFCGVGSSLKSKTKAILKYDQMELYLKKLNSNSNYLDEILFSKLISHLAQISRLETVQINFSNSPKKNLMIQKFYSTYLEDAVIIANTQGHENLAVDGLINKYFKSHNPGEIVAELAPIFKHADKFLQSIYAVYFYKNNFENLRDSFKSHVRENAQSYIEFEKKLEYGRQGMITFCREFCILYTLIKEDLMLQAYDLMIDHLLSNVYNKIKNLKEFGRVTGSKNCITSNFGNIKMVSPIKKDFMGSGKLLRNLSSLEIEKSFDKASDAVSTKINKTGGNTIKTDMNKNTLFNIFSYSNFKIFLSLLADLIFRKNDSESATKLCLLDKFILLLEHMERSNGAANLHKHNPSVVVETEYLFAKSEIESKKPFKHLSINDFSLQMTDKDIHKPNLDFWNLGKLMEMNIDFSVKLITSELKVIRMVFMFYANLNEKVTLNSSLSCSNFLTFLSKTKFNSTLFKDIDNSKANKNHLGSVLYSELISKTYGSFNKDKAEFSIDIFVQVLYILAIKLNPKESANDALFKFIKEDLKDIYNVILPSVPEFARYDILLGNKVCQAIIAKIDQFIKPYYLIFSKKDVDESMNQTIDFNGIKSFLSSFDLYPSLISYNQAKSVYLYLLDLISKQYYCINH